MTDRDARAIEGKMEMRTVSKENASRLNAFRHIGDANLDRNVCETPVAVSCVTSHRPPNKNSQLPSSSFCYYE
jgi:hypothetical protein